MFGVSLQNDHVFGPLFIFQYYCKTRKLRTIRKEKQRLNWKQYSQLENQCIWRLKNSWFPARLINKLGWGICWHNSAIACTSRWLFTLCNLNFYLLLILKNNNLPKAWNISVSIPISTPSNPSWVRRVVLVSFDKLNLF